MKVQYHLTPEQIQETIVLLELAQKGKEIPGWVVCIADIKIYGDTNKEAFIDLPGIWLVGLFREIRNFLKSDKASAKIYGWADCQYGLELSMPRKTSWLTVDHGRAGSIKIKPSTPETMSKVLQAFLQGYLRHVPQIASYSGLDFWEQEFNFKIRR